MLKNACRQGLPMYNTVQRTRVRFMQASGLVAERYRTSHEKRIEHSPPLLSHSPLS